MTSFLGEREEGLLVEFCRVTGFIPGSIVIYRSIGIYRGVKGLRNTTPAQDSLSTRVLWVERQANDRIPKDSVGDLGKCNVPLGGFNYINRKVSGGMSHKAG